MKCKVCGNELLNMPCAYCSELEKHKPTPAEEPLAVLADRKGMWIKEIVHEDFWYILISDKSHNTAGSRIVEDTYAEAESKARQYLHKLPDREAK